MFAIAPRELEWYVASGVVITVVWIYLELLARMGDDRRLTTQRRSMTR